MSIPVLHLTDRLALGGAQRIMHGMAVRPPHKVFHHILAGLSVGEGYVAALRTDGVRCGCVGESLESLSTLVQEPFLAVVHRSGEENERWTRLHALLRERGAVGQVVQNVFSYADGGTSDAVVDLRMFYSRDACRQHWKRMGCPPVTEYLRRHRVLHCAVTLSATADRLARLRTRLRQSLGIPEDAFVIGDVCRPDPRKLDAMSLGVVPRLLMRVPNAFFLARRFPDSFADALRARAPGHVFNLAFAGESDEMLATYAAMDVMAHFSTMGESFGMAIAEAMRCGVPVVGNETPRESCDNAQGELILDGETGYLANDPLTAVWRLQALAADPALRARLGQNAQARMQRAPYAPEAVRQQLESELVRLAASKGLMALEGLDCAGRDPSDEQMADYLRTGKRRWRVAPARGLAVLHPWVWRAQWERILWRWRRRRAC